MTQSAESGAPLAMRCAMGEHDRCSFVGSCGCDCHMPPRVGETVTVTGVVRTVSLAPEGRLFIEVETDQYRIPR